MLPGRQLGGSVCTYSHGNRYLAVSMTASPCFLNLLFSSLRCAPHSLFSFYVLICNNDETLDALITVISSSRSVLQSSEAHRPGVCFNIADLYDCSVYEDGSLTFQHTCIIICVFLHETCFRTIFLFRNIYLFKRYHGFYTLMCADLFQFLCSSKLSNKRMLVDTFVGLPVLS